MEDSTFSFSVEGSGFADRIRSSSEALDGGINPDVPAMQFEPLHEGPAKIKVIGVGGGGGNAVNHMYRQGIHGVEFIVCNTDAKALESSPVPNKIVLGKLGAGNVPSHAREMALAHKDEIRQAISDDTQMLFITAGMGGGTGTGAAPVIAEIAKSIELDDEMVKRILVVAIVTEPFFFEGRKRLEQAKAGIEELSKHVDAILVINNDKLRKLGNMSLKDAFSQADDVLLTAAKGIAEIITVSAYVNIDFRDVNTVMEKSGTALMGAGEGRGEDRARQAIEAATTSVLLNDNDIRGAQNILLYFSCSPDHQITMDELGEVTDFLTERTGNNGANVIWGIGDDESLNDELRITLIATGFKQKPDRIVHDLNEVKPAPVPTPDPDKEPDADKKPAAGNELNAFGVDVTPVPPVDVHEPPVDDSGIHIVHKAPTSTPAGTPSATPTGTPSATPTSPSASAGAPTSSWASPAEPAGTPTSQSASSPVTPVDDNPFDSVKAGSDGKRRVTLDIPAVEETLETVETLTKEPAAFSVVTKEPDDNRSYLDDIRVFRKQQPIANTQQPIDNTQQPIANTQQSYADQQMEQVFNPQTDERKIMDRAERIKKLNEMLRNDPDGPRKVEEMSTEELLGRPVYVTNHSSESDAARTTIDAFGSFSKGMSFLDNLPD